MAQTGDPGCRGNRVSEENRTRQSGTWEVRQPDLTPTKHRSALHFAMHSGIHVDRGTSDEAARVQRRSGRMAALDGCAASERTRRAYLCADPDYVQASD